MSKIDFMSLKTIDFCDDVRDGTHDSPKHLDSGKLLITSKNIKGDSIDFENASYISEEDYNKINERSLVEINDVLYSMIGTVGLVYRVDQQPNYAIKNMGLFKIHDELKSKWLYYYLNSPKAKGKVLSMLSGSTQKFISLSNLRNLEIEFPQNIDDAKRIIKICESIDKKIKLNNKINNNLYELAINYLNEKVEETEVPVSKFAKIQGGYAFKSKDLIDVHTKNRIIKIKNLRSEINADVINSQFVENKVVEKLDNKFRLSKGDVAIAMTGAELGKTGFIYGNDNYFLNQRVGVIRGNNKACELYLKILFLSDEFQTLLNSKGYGSAQPNVSTSDIENILINDITEDNLKKLYEIIKPIYEKIISNSEEILNLEQLRDTLLPKMMNGEIDLDNIEI